ncbi:helix-turn-helix domain-containing protein [Streptomyces tropicalis]|uniref:Helix-turn-helix domain-containing protein n=1 Tax=Streptomyces tropicalis TaxID=3034234 RepID=A0ABT6A201_9ACTN|nr:helix-turn-helix domain-containing protein [Streptomyces tropicalis]MDF3298673.1 helix-turn-helix domain-containing protein [Streptomyces tropicalis]
MTTPHPAASRTRVLELLSEGHPAGEVARMLDIPPSTVYRWRRTLVAPSSLPLARGRIQELEAELLLCRRTIDALNDVMPPKGVTR